MMMMMMMDKGKNEQSASTKPPKKNLIEVAVGVGQNVVHHAANLDLGRHVSFESNRVLQLGNARLQLLNLLIQLIDARLGRNLNVRTSGTDTQI